MINEMNHVMRINLCKFVTNDVNYESVLGNLHFYKQLVFQFKIKKFFYFPLMVSKILKKCEVTSSNKLL